jgi:hypothetical protein
LGTRFETPKFASFLSPSPALSLSCSTYPLPSPHLNNHSLPGTVRLRRLLWGPCQRSHLLTNLVLTLSFTLGNTLARTLRGSPQVKSPHYVRHCSVTVTNHAFIVRRQISRYKPSGHQPPHSGMLQFCLSSKITLTLNPGPTRASASTATTAGMRHSHWYPKILLVVCVCA